MQSLFSVQAYFYTIEIISLNGEGGEEDGTRKVLENPRRYLRLPYVYRKELAFHSKEGLTPKYFHTEYDKRK